MSDAANAAAATPDSSATVATGMAATRATLDVLARALPNLLWIADADGRIKYANERWTRYTGHTVDRLNTEASGPRGIVHPADVEKTWDLWRHSLATGEPYEISYRLRNAADGSYRWFLSRAEPVRNATGAIEEWIGVATDIDAEMRAGAGSRFFTEAALVLSSSLEREALMRDFAHLAVRLFCDACFVLLRETDGSLHTAAVAHRERHVEELLIEAAKTTRISPGGPVEHVLRTREPVLIREVSSDMIQSADLKAEQRHALGALDLKSIMVVPLVLADTLIGALSFVSSDPARLYDGNDLDIAVAAARHVALAIENARSFERERRSTDRLRFLARVTDELFTTLDARVTLQRVLDAIVGDMADWCAVLAFVQRGGLRVEAVAHRDPDKQPLVEQLLRQRPLHAETERRLTARMRHHRAWVGDDALRTMAPNAVQPHLINIIAQLSPLAEVVAPLYLGNAMYGALVAYSSTPDYSEEDREVLEEVGRRTSLALEHVRSFERERHLAQTLQEATLPAQLPSIPEALLSTAYFPATSELLVGGDWYDAFELGDGRLIFTIGDVTGHGLQASVIMSKLRHFFNVIAMYESDPARILDAAERVLLQRYPAAIATAFLAIYDRKRQLLMYANAGHPYPLARLRDGRIIELEAHGFPIGLRTFGERGTSRSRTIEDIAVLSLYTDGLVEATRDIERGEQRLKTALGKEAVLFTRSAAAFIAASCLPARSHDDVALLVLSMPRSVVWAFDADDAGSAQGARREFVAHLRQDAAPDSDFAAAELIFGELVGNVVRHAPGAIDIALEWRGSCALLHVIDRGRGFAASRARAVEPLSEDGRGLWLIHLLGRGVKVERLPHFGNHVRVVLPVDRKRERLPDDYSEEPLEQRAFGT